MLLNIVRVNRSDFIVLTAETVEIYISSEVRLMYINFYDHYNYCLQVCHFHSLTLISHSTVVLVLILVIGTLVSFFIVLYLKKRSKYKSWHAIVYV